jgi:hypothetical protein
MLACVAPLDDIPGIMQHRKPVEPQTEGLGDEGSTTGVMPVGAFVDVLKKGDAVLGCDASLEDVCCAALVELSLDYAEGLGVVHDLTAMDSVFWQLASQQVGEVWLRPYCFN